MKKLLALILALALMASFTAVFAASETEPAPDLPPEAPVETESLVTEDLKKQIVPEAEVPDLIDYSVAVEEKYVCRAYWEETDLNEVVFLKSDGTLARYYFAIPVKYEENGEVFDKKPALVERETLLNNLYRYELTAQNDTAFYCPDNLTYGFLYQGGGMEVALRPITQSEYDFLRGHMNAGDMVLPQNILPEGFDSQAVTGTAKSALSVTDEATTAARYVLSTEGEQVNSAFASQDILSAVPSYNGFQLQLDLAEGALTQTVYFELDSELLPVPTEGGLLLCDHTGKAVGILGDLLSESGVRNDIPWTVTESLSGTYLLSATLPRNGENYTVSTTQIFDDLQDVTIYQNDSDCYGIYPLLKVGYTSSLGFTRTLIRPNNWSFTNSGNTADMLIHVASVVLYQTDQSDPSLDIEARPFTGSAWDQTSAAWGTVSGGSYGGVMDTQTVVVNGDSNFYSFDVTARVRMWYSGNSSWQKGIVLRWTGEADSYGSVYSEFAATEHSNEAYRPRLKVVTSSVPVLQDGLYSIRSTTLTSRYKMATEQKAVDLTAATPTPETLPVSIKTDSAENGLWRITHLQNGYYTVRPYHYTPAGLKASGTNVTTSYLGYYDDWDSVSSGFLWYIRGTVMPEGGNPDESYFYLQPYGSGLRLELRNPTTTMTVCVGDDYGGPEHKWRIQPKGSPPYRIFLYNTSDGSPVANPSLHIHGEASLDLNSLGYYVSVSVPISESVSPSECVWSAGEHVWISCTEDQLFFYPIEFGSSKVVASLNSEELDTLGLTVSTYCSGNCYLRNSGTKLSITALSAGTSSSAAVECQILQGTAAQNWLIEPHSVWNNQTTEIYHTISCVVNGTTYYLCTPQSTLTEGDTVVLKTAENGIIANEMYWQMHYFQASQDSGIRLKIAPKGTGDHNFVLACQIQGNALTDSLIIKNCSNNDDTETWESASFVPCDKELSAILLADESFRNAHEDYVQVITKYMEDANLYYATNFGIAIEYSSVTAYSSFAEQCSTSGSSVENNCTCVDDEGNSIHHKSVDNNFGYLPYGVAKEQIYISFTKHIMCDETCSDNGSHDDTGILGLADDGEGRVLVRENANVGSNLTPQKKDEMLRKKTQMVLIHELGHIFKAPDHSDTVPGDKSYSSEELSYNNKKPYYPDCIYGEHLWNADIYENLTLCSGCRSDIETELNDPAYRKGE